MQIRNFLWSDTDTAVVKSSETIPFVTFIVPELPLQLPQLDLRLDGLEQPPLGLPQLHLDLPQPQVDVPHLRLRPLQLQVRLVQLHQGEEEGQLEVRLEVPRRKGREETPGITGKYAGKCVEDCPDHWLEYREILELNVEIRI